jgi:serine/threonine protein kinase
MLASCSIAKPTTTARGTIQYMAPELLKFDDEDVSATQSMQSKEVDIWAFGMTIIVSCLVLVCCISLHTN